MAEPETTMRGVPRLRFVKVEGLGNDFLLVDRSNAAGPEVERELADLSDAAPRLCERRRGVGGDGLLIILPPTSANADATMRVINHDGSRPEMCGNGLRCVAQAVAEAVGRWTVHIDTDAGLKRCTVEPRPGGAWVEVDMGPGRDGGIVRIPAANHRMFHRVSMGNPHAVAFIDPREDPRALAYEVGPQIEVDRSFPNRTNVEFARIEHDGSVTLWVWERGCGITEACGTGACATIAAGCWEERLPFERPVSVHLPGGELLVTVPRQGGVRMAGPARVVFEGEVELGN